MTAYVPECPGCGEDMVIRTNRITGEQFYGCSMYPQCDETESIDGNPNKIEYPDLPKDPGQ